MLRKVCPSFHKPKLFSEYEDKTLPRMIEVSFKSIRAAEKKMWAWWDTFQNWQKLAEPRPHRSAGLARKTTLSTQLHTVFVLFKSQAKQPVAEELIASDWMKIRCNLLGLVATKIFTKKSFGVQNGLEETKTKCKATHSSSKRNRTRKQDCCYPVVVRPIPMTQSDWCPGDYNMTIWPLNCLCRTCSRLQVKFADLILF